MRCTLENDRPLCCAMPRELQCVATAGTLSTVFHDHNLNAGIIDRAGRPGTWLVVQAIHPALGIPPAPPRRRPTIFPTARSASSCRRRPAPASTCRRACWRRRWASYGASRASWTIARAPTPSEAAAKAAPDGYTLVYAPVSAVTTNAYIYKKLPCDPVRDFAPITQTTANPLGAVVNPAFGIKSISASSSVPD